MRRKVALKTLVWAATLDSICGILFSGIEHTPIGIGLYWALATATTVGYGDVTPHTTPGHIIAALVMLTVVPLFAATFSLLTTALTAEHVSSETAAVRKRLDHVIRHEPAIPAFHDKVDSDRLNS